MSIAAPAFTSTPRGPGTGALVRVVTVLPGSEPRYDADQVVVDVLLSGSVRVRGVARAIDASTHLAPPVFSSLTPALVAAEAFARMHGIDHICLVNHSAPVLLAGTASKASAYVPGRQGLAA